MFSYDLSMVLLAFTSYEKFKTHNDDTYYMKIKNFTYHELASSTKKFKNIIGEWDLGCVYKGVPKSGELSYNFFNYLLIIIYMC